MWIIRTPDSRSVRDAQGTRLYECVCVRERERRGGERERERAQKREGKREKERESVCVRPGVWIIRRPGSRSIQEIPSESAVRIEGTAGEY